MNNSAELKNDLIRLIIEMEDVSLLQQLKKMLLGKVKDDSDWANELTVSQLEQIKIGALQIKAGEFVSSNELHKETKAFFEQKRNEQK